MPTLSHRIQTLNGGGSDGWALFYRARAMAEAGESVIELTIGEHDDRTDVGILQQMHNAAIAGATGYALVPGIAPLRAEIARRITAQTGVPTAPDNVIVTAGGQAALFAAHMTAGDAGDAALFVDPYYATYPGTLRAAGLVPHALITEATRDFLPDPATLDALAAQTQARCLLINSPNNPTGTVYPKATLQGIARVMQDRDMWLISDEVYESQVWEGTHLSPRALPGMAGRTIMVGSMSKGHAMTGSRIGWVCAPEPVIERLIDLATITTYGVPGFIQEAALFALHQGPEFEARIAAPFRRRRDLALRVLSQSTARHDLRAVPAQGAMYVMLDVRATGLCGEAFADRLLDDRRIAVMPGESFGQAAAGHVRVALTVADDSLEQALHDICTFAEKAAHAA